MFLSWYPDKPWQLFSFLHYKRVFLRYQVLWHYVGCCATVCNSLLEMMLESSLSDLRDAQGVFLPFCPSLVRLLRLLQDFLFAEGTDNHTLWSEKVHLTACLTHRLDFLSHTQSKCLKLDTTDSMRWEYISLNAIIILHSFIGQHHAGLVTQ